MSNRPPSVPPPWRDEPEPVGTGLIALLIGVLYGFVVGFIVGFYFYGGF